MTITLMIGDRVTWTDVRRQGSGIRFRTCQGTILGITRVDSRIKLRNGRETWVLNTNLRRIDQPTELTEAFNAITSPRVRALIGWPAAGTIVEAA
jgi:hypothetical protein